MDGAFWILVSYLFTLRIQDFIIMSTTGKRKEMRKQNQVYQLQEINGQLVTPLDSPLVWAFLFHLLCLLFLVFNSIKIFLKDNNYVLQRKKKKINKSLPRSLH
jgi:hypothetical protein